MWLQQGLAGVKLDHKGCEEEWPWDNPPVNQREKLIYFLCFEANTYMQQVPEEIHGFFLLFLGLMSNDPQKWGQVEAQLSL